MAVEDSKTTKDLGVASILEQLREMTVVVADTGDIEAVSRLKPVDCTTNPSIVLKALGTDQFADTMNDAIAWGKSQTGAHAAIIDAVADRLAIAVGAELAAIVPGRVSTEVDADLSFDTKASIEKGREIIAAYDKLGISREQILIKLASTWEGLRASEVLQSEGIDTNMTLMFSKAQAIAAADAKAFLISPFVGRILDWYKADTGQDYTSETDPGVLSVREIYNYYKSNGIDTVVMGASFRNMGEITALAGCDRLTISPNLLDELDAATGTLERKLSPNSIMSVDPIKMDENTFRWMMNEDAMATEKLAQGIRGFAADLQKLRVIIDEKLTAA